MISVHKARKTEEPQMSPKCCGELCRRSSLLIVYRQRDDFLGCQLHFTKRRLERDEGDVLVKTAQNMLEDKFRISHADCSTMWQNRQQQGQGWRPRAGYTPNYPQHQPWNGRNDDFPPLSEPNSYRGRGLQSGTPARVFNQPNYARPRRTEEDSRQWLFSKENALPAGERFRILSYNILSVDNAREHYRELYWHIPMRFVKWEYRKFRLLAELEYWSPDILCLQEVDRFDDLRKDLQAKGYSGIYKGRTGIATDGCAIFWRGNRFALLEEESIEFKDHELRDNVAQFCVLKSTKYKSKNSNINDPRERAKGSLVVANTHVLFNPKRGDIKLGQVRTLLDMAHELSTRWGGAQVVVAGDFNSTPSSPIYKFISTAELDVKSMDRRSISGQFSAGEGRPYFQSSSWRRYPNNNSAVNNRNSTPSSSSSSSTTSSSVVTMHVEEDSKQADSENEEGNNNVTMEVKTEENISEVAKTTSDALVVVKTESNELMISQQNVSITTSSSEENFVGELSMRSRFVYRSPFDWNKEELKNATGSTESTKLSHKLQLRSAYSEIEVEDGSRDSNGEPLVTSYHKKFMGTVDYIWHTNGLHPVRILDVLPVEILRRTGGLPTQKWGSDHMALVCEMILSQHSL